MNAKRLLIALNAHPRMQRGAICRLGLEPDLWRALRPGDSASAAQLGVPVRQLDYALDTLARAERVADAQLRQADELGVRILTPEDPDYPRVLFEHPLPPPVLYCRGRLPDAPAVGMVGARRCDGYGREVARCFASQLARAGVVIVSGFALGIDQAAHRGAIDGGGLTVAVLGCGVDVGYPKHSRKLADEIADHGALLSEYPLGREPRNWHFPIRNRVIATLSQSVVVVQAKVRSGSLITAHAALELGRDVFAVPGRIFDELSLGTNGLLADGAIPANSVDDVLGHLGFAAGRPTGLAGTGSSRSAATTDEAQGRLPLGDPPTQAAGTTQATEPPETIEDEEPRPPGLAGALLDALPRGDRGKTAEDLATTLDQKVDRVLGALLELELGGRIERLPGPVYTR